MRRFLLSLSLLALLTSTAAGQAVDIDGTFTELRTTLYASLANQISAIPNASGGSFKYSFDPTMGVFQRRTRSFGPVFVERAETSGQGTTTFSFIASFFSFDQVDGVDLDTGMFSLLGATTVNQGGGDELLFDLVTVTEKVSVSSFTLNGVHGVTDWLDVGLSVPLLKVSVEEEVFEEGFFFCELDFSSCSDPTLTGQFFRSNQKESVGLGDVTLRAKASLLRPASVHTDGVAIGLAVDVSLPTGSEGDFEAFASPETGVDITLADISGQQFQLGDPPLGAGTVRVRPMLLISGSFGGLSPHANIGAQFGESEGVSNDLLLEVGLDVTVQDKITFSGDFLGRRALDVTRTRVVENSLIDPNYGQTAEADLLGASLGTKIYLGGTSLLFANVLLALNDVGIRDKVTPTLGVEWTF